MFAKRFWLLTIFVVVGVVAVSCATPTSAPMAQPTNTPQMAEPSPTPIRRRMRRILHRFRRRRRLNRRRRPRCPICRRMMMG